MFSLSLRQLVSFIGLFVALTTALSIPVGYGVVSYRDEADLLAFKARLNASRVAKYVYQHGSLWTFQHVRLAELIELPEALEDRVRQRIHAADGRLVLDEGDALAWPTVSQSSPVVVSGAVVGHVQVEASGRSLVTATGLVALFSCALGLLAYLGIRLLPLRVLDRTLGELAARERDLSQKNAQLDAALGNMMQGLCMFDASDRLVVANRRFLDLYRLPEAASEPGISFRRMLEISKATGNFPDRTVDEVATQRRAIIARGESVAFLQELDGERTIAIAHMPLADGGWVATYEDITDRRRAEAQIAHMAHHDALTGLPNRVLFRETLERALEAARTGEGPAVLFLDLDHFKAVNDTLGHPVGDALLAAVAERLAACLGPDDALARLSGDEFAIVGSGASREAPAGLAQRLIDALAAPFDLDGHGVVIGTSVGIALAPADSDTADGLIKAADMALYRAKADGRGTYRFFEAEMDARMQERRTLEVDLRRALASGEFEVHYQPLINLATDRVSGFEALLRWTHPERGRVSPADFVPLAEEIGLIGRIGAFVLREACAQAATWPDEISLAVNLSSVQFQSRTLVLDVVAALGASGLPARRLELEITETVMLQETDATLAILHELRALGVRISMDDFGTGYSSLSYLRRFPFDKIKIDRSFTRDLPQGHDAVAIVKAVAGLGASLGMTTTAEGVETEEQLAALRREGCTEVQGFLFSPARPAADVPGLLAAIAARQAA